MLRLVQDDDLYGDDLDTVEALQARLFDSWAEWVAMRRRTIASQPPEDTYGLLLATLAYETVVQWHWGCYEGDPAAGEAGKLDGGEVPCPPEVDLWLAALWATLLNIPGVSNLASPLPPSHHLNLLSTQHRVRC